jgi:hypothetical protein
VPVTHAPTPRYFFWIGFGISLFLGGFGSLTALALAAPDNPLCRWWWDALAAIALLTGLTGAWFLSNVFFGWPPLPLTHEERQNEKRRRGEL